LRYTFIAKDNARNHGQPLYSKSGQVGEPSTLMP